MMQVTTEWESDDGGEDEDEIHDHEYRLQATHDARDDRGEDCVEQHAAGEDAPHSGVCWCVGSISCVEHER